VEPYPLKFIHLNKEQSMAQSSDIVLNGDPYMLVGARGREGYTRSQDGIDEGRTGRIQQSDFFGGLIRPFQLERDRGWNGTTVGPAHGGQGVSPWPFSDTVVLDAGSPLADIAWEYPSAVIRDHVFFAVGQFLYRAASITGGSWATPTQVWDAGSGNAISSLCYYGGNLLVCCGGAVDVTHLIYPGTTPAVLFAGERGHHIVSYQGYAIWSDARAAGSGGYANMLRMVTGSGIQFRWVDSPIKRLTTAQAEVTIATGAAVYAYSGRVAEVEIPNPGTPPPDRVEVLRWTGDVRPFFQHGTATYADDFRFITGFGGRTYAWIGGMVLEHDPEGERAGWRDTGLAGVRCHGAAVCAGYLVISIVSADNFSELWAWDGSGWWIIHRQEWSGSDELLQPIPLAGTGGYDLGVIQRGTQTMRRFRLVWRSAVQHNYPLGESHYITSLIDASERDKAKAWRKIGAVFASPDIPGNPASTDQVELWLDYSTDAGGTWMNATSTVIAGNSLASNNRTLDAGVASDVAVSRFLMLRVRWTSIADWAPILVDLWAEFEVIDSPARRQRWQFTVIAQDQVIDRDGSTLTRSGRQQITELWDHWQHGTTVPFRDLDYDDVTVERRVRIVGISETAPIPHQAGNWGQSAVSLTLVEV
jgi:hypothetical protein